MQKKRSIKQQRQEQARRKRLLTLGGIITAAVVLVAIMIAVNFRPIGSFIEVAKQEWPQADGSTLGPANAPVVLREFADFQCPYCALYFRNIEKQVIDQYVKTRKVRYEFHHLIVIDSNVGGTESRQAALAGECAAEQDGFWDYHNLLYTNQQGEGSGAFSDNRLKAFAASLGMDTGKFNSCLDSQKYKDKITSDAALARSLSVTSTPTLFVNDQKVSNPQDWGTVKSSIDAALAAVK